MRLPAAIGSLLLCQAPVGQPRGGGPRAAYVVYDPGERYVEFRRVAYDVRKAQAKILKAGLPDLLAERLDTGN
jgi:diadenosine tetraphosphatase ApaH/serine/threonine PP2A family protein phosphatase